MVVMVLLKQSITSTAAATWQAPQANESMVCWFATLES